MEEERVISGSGRQEEEAVERAIRPRRLAEYVGQAQVKTQLEIFITAARQRAEALDHVLIFGPPGQLGTAPGLCPCSVTTPNTRPPVGGCNC